MPKSNYFTSIIIATALGLASCSREKAKEDGSSAKPVAVITATANSNKEQSVLASGQVESIHTAKISTRIMGRISNIVVKVGDQVAKGQVLATISDEDIRAKRAQTNAMITEAEAAFANAKKNLERFTTLYKQQSATALELDDVTLQYNSAKARLDAARQTRSEVNVSLSYTTLTAPFAGVVTQKLAEVGSIANPGIPILIVEQNKLHQVSASVVESEIGQIHMGDVAHMLVKSTGNRFDGEIMQLNPSSQFSGGQYTIKISIPSSIEKNLYAGMTVSVNIPLKETAQMNECRVMVPLSAIVYRDDLTGIYTVSRTNTALLRWIKIGNTYGDKAEVLSGLSINEEYIQNAEGKLYNGAPVVVTQSQPSRATNDR